MNCILCGVGGQGTVLASKLIAQSAINQNLPAKTAETIGMAQRGGCVVSHVRVGSDIYSPIIPKHQADILIGFEPAEAVRNLSYLKTDGTIIVSKKAVMPVTSSLSSTAYSGDDMISYLQQIASHVFIVDTDNICLQCGSSKVMNVALLGAAVASGVLNITIDEMTETLRQKVKPQFFSMNEKALRLGAESVQKG